MTNDAKAARLDDRIAGPVAASGVVLGGKYRLEEAIARGGMARVWRARHIELNRPVAVKFVDGAGAGANGIERFLIEAKVAASIRHKNVVDILDFGFVERAGRDPEPYMVMELLEGETLGDRIGRGPLRDDESVDIALQLLNGLDAVHRAGIIHRDLKPGNLFLTHDHDGTFARLLDFGISEDAEQRPMGETGQVVGTPEYMSPEQAFGGAIDLRADLYGVGVMLYEMLGGGRLPFEHDEPHRVLEMVAAGVHTSLVALRPDQPELAAVVERALARTPDDRYASAREMRRAIIDASGRPDNTTDRMAAIRESGTQRRPQAATAPELVAPRVPMPSLPAGSPLLVVPMPASATARPRSFAPIATVVVVVLVASVGAVWAMTSGAAPVASEAAIHEAAPATPVETTEEATSEEETSEDATADEGNAEATADEATAEAELPEDAPSEALTEASGGPVVGEVGADEAAAEDAPALTARRPRGVRRPPASSATTESAASSAPADPPRAVVRDLDF